MKNCLYSIVVITFLITGCVGRRELSDVSFIKMAGFDMLEDGTIEVTVNSTIPLISNTTIGGGSLNTWIGAGKGITILEATEHILERCPKKNVWFHNDFIILGEEFAKNGIDLLTDFFLRNRENRYDTNILVYEGKAKELLSLPSEISSNLSQELGGRFNNISELDHVYTSKVEDFMENYYSDVLEMVVGKVKIEEKNGPNTSHSMQIERTMEKPGGIYEEIDFDGIGVFNKEKLVGYLDSEETKGYIWIVNKKGKGRVYLNGEDKKVKYVYEVKSGNTDIDIKDNNGEMTYNIKVRTSGTLAETNSKEELFDEKILQKIQKKAEDEIQKLMENCLNKLQKDYKTDSVGFQRKMQIQHPKYWKTVKDDWEKYFSKIKVNYDIKVEIKRNMLKYDEVK